MRVALLCLGCGLCSLLYAFSQLALSLEQEAPRRRGDPTFPVRRQLSGGGWRAVAGSAGRRDRPLLLPSERYVCGGPCGRQASLHCARRESHFHFIVRREGKCWLRSLLIVRQELIPAYQTSSQFCILLVKKDIWKTGENISPLLPPSLVNTTGWLEANFCCSSA